jgi:hypothetical protein
MEDRFFYSTDGTDGHGPVTREALRVLHQNKVIGSRSFLCREGEKEWKPFHPETDLRSPSGRPQPFEPPPYVPTPEAQERMQVPDLSDFDDGPFPRTFTVIFWLLFFFGGYFVMKGAVAADIVPPTWLASLVVRIFIASIPALIAELFKRPYRHIVRGIVLVILLSVTLYALQRENEALLLEQEAITNEQLKEQARQELAEKAYSPGDSQKVEQNIQTIRNETTGNSEGARLTRDILDVDNSLMGKVTATQQLEKVCRFDPITITDLDDLGQRRDALRKLRDAQSEVLTFLHFYDSHCREAIAHDDFPPSVVEKTVADARKASHVEFLVKLWQINIKVSDDHIARLDFLEKNWGLWKVKDGKLVFEEKDSAVTYDTLVAALQNDAEKIGAIQKQIFQ